MPHKKLIIVEHFKKIQYVYTKIYGTNGHISMPPTTAAAADRWWWWGWRRFFKDYACYHDVRNIKYNITYS